MQKAATHRKGRKRNFSFRMRYFPSTSVRHTSTDPRRESISAMTTMIVKYLVTGRAAYFLMYTNKEADMIAARAGIRT